MRELATFDDRATAEVLGDALTGAGIDAEVKPERGERFVVWVVEHGQLPEARELLSDFESDGAAADWKRLAKEGRARRAKQARDEAHYRKQNEKLREQVEAIRSDESRQIGKITLGLIVISVAVAVMTQLGKRSDIVSYFTIASFETVGDQIQWRWLHDITSGEVWRLFTPMFIHFGLIHLLFNMWWLKDLGTVIEREQKPWVLLVLVLAIAGISNLIQYYWPPVSPLFGGMSGVVYGLLGYLWVRGQFNPKARVRLEQRTIAIMIGWLFLCMTGLVGPVANAAHVSGLIAGGAWAYLRSGHIGRSLRRR